MAMHIERYIFIDIDIDVDIREISPFDTWTFYTNLLISTQSAGAQNGRRPALRDALSKNQKLSAGHLTGGVDQNSSLLPTGNLSKMPSLCHCVLPLCSNRKNNCKFGLFPGDNGQYEKRRLCGHPSDLRGGCKAESEQCKRLSFYRLPRNEDLRRRWIAAIPRSNTPLMENSYVCGHFVGGR